MKKRTVGIYANYDASEQTFCAMLLAGYISRCYRHAAWFVPNGIKKGSSVKGLSHQYDSEIVACDDGKDVYIRRAKECDTFFFFECNEELFSILPKGAVTAFVVNPHTFDSASLSFARKCTYSLLVDDTLRREMRKCDYLQNAVSFPFDPLLPSIPKVNVNFAENAWVLYPAFGLSRGSRRLVKQVAEMVKLCCPHIRSTVAYYDKSESPVPEEGIDTLCHDWRLVKYLHNADWIIDLNTQPSLCLFPTFAGCYGIQWSGFNVSPNTDKFNQARRHLIETPVKKAGRWAERAMPDVEDTVTQIVRQLTGTFYNDLDRNRASGIYDQRKNVFIKTIGMLLGSKVKF